VGLVTVARPIGLVLAGTCILPLHPANPYRPRHSLSEPSQ
jgi:hypothetical protein